MDKASEAILALKPATFRYKHELDPKGIPQFGLVAEEVEKVNPVERQDIFPELRDRVSPVGLDRLLVWPIHHTA